MEELVGLAGQEAPAANIRDPMPIRSAQVLRPSYYRGESGDGPGPVSASSLSVALTTAPSTFLCVRGLVTVTTTSTHPDSHW